MSHSGHLIVGPLVPSRGRGPCFEHSHSLQEAPLRLTSRRHLHPQGPQPYAQSYPASTSYLIMIPIWRQQLTPLTTCGILFSEGIMNEPAWLTEAINALDFPNPPLPFDLEPDNIPYIECEEMLTLAEQHINTCSYCLRIMAYLHWSKE